MSLDDIVSVTITTETTSPTRAGFGVPMVFAYHTVFPERARTYTSLQSVLDDGFDADSPVARCVGSLFSQNPRPSSVVVGRAANAPTQLIDVEVITAVDDTDYTMTINGTDFTIDSGGAATVNSIATALQVAINGGTEPVTAGTVTGGAFTLTADVAGDLFTLEQDRGFITKQTVTLDPGVAADIAAIQAVNDDWYSLHLTSLSLAEISAAAAYIETQVKLMVTSTSDDDILTTSTSDIASVLAAANYGRTALLWHPNAETYYPGAGWAGGRLPNDPGSQTWKFKTIAGSPVTVITETEKTNVEGKSCNHYREIAGVAITQQGVVAGGEFIDVVRFVDWVRSELQADIYTLFVNKPKVPYTDPGIGSIEAVVWAVMNRGIDAGGFAANPEPEVTVPLAENVATADKLARTLRNVDFTAVLAGAIHKAIVTGTVTV